MSLFTDLYTRCSKTAVRWVVLFAVVTPATFFAGYAVGDRTPEISFHDMIVNHPEEMTALIDVNDKRVVQLARRLGSPEEIYLFVRDKIVFDAALPSVPAGDIIGEGRASCLGKAVLLCSLYRAAGIPADKVRIVTGEVDAIGGPVDHAWVELEYNGGCIQQDTTDMLGRFEFGQFKGMAYTNAFIRREGYVFNDQNFAIVSRLNMMRGSNHPMLVKR